MVGTIQYYLGDVCMVQGDQELGKEYVQKALETFAAIGAKSWIHRSEEMLGSLK
jgi:hypothetical protein